MRLNVKKVQTPKVTHEGGKAAQTNVTQDLRRSVLACLLWEDSFYESGQEIADRIVQLATKAPDKVVHDLAIEARTKYNLRHVPLLLLAAKPNADAIYNTIQRADELAELLAIYWRKGRKSIPAQMKKGLARAFTKFDEYALAKYNRENSVKLRDVLFMVHAKPLNKEQALLWERLVNNELNAPDTWEVALSAGKDKKETFERLLQEGKIGYLAVLRNLRNMEQAGVDANLMRSTILARKGANRVLPFRYIAAARHAVSFEPELDKAMQDSLADLPKLAGTTLVLVDVSGSMAGPLSGKSDLTRLDAAAALAVVVNSDHKVVYTFADKVVQAPARPGMGGIDAVIRSQPRGGTYLKRAIEELNQKVKYDRIIVITDEQSHDGIAAPLAGSKAYLINVAAYRNGVGYGQWTHIEGFSENVIRYISECENAM